MVQKGAVLAGAVVLLVLVATVLLLLLPSGRQSRTPVARPTRELAKNYPFERGTCPAAINATQISVASHDSPRIFVYRNFMTAEEADYVIKYGEAVGLRRSEVATKDANSLSEVRTSTGTFLSSKGDPVLEAIEARIAAWAQVPVENGEAFYLLRYEEGQQYKPHYDFFDVSSLSLSLFPLPPFLPSADACAQPNLPGMDHFIGKAGNRIATVLIYLNAPDEGGATVFPKAEIMVPAERLTAVLFWSMTPETELDWESLHGGMPVVSGVKMAMTKWMRINQWG